MNLNDNELRWAVDNYVEGEEVKIPSKIEEDGGRDIYAYFEDPVIVIAPQTTVLIPTGLHSAFSSKYVGIIKDRSSSGTKCMAVRAGVMDSGYRGEWLVPINNTSDHNIVIAKEEIVKQLNGIKEIVVKDKNKHNIVVDLSKDVIYPYEKAIAQVIFVEVPQFNEAVISLEELNSIYSIRGDGKLGSTNK